MRSLKGRTLKKFFTSVKLTLVLLILIALASVVGTLVPQGGVTEELSHRFSPGVLSILKGLQLFDIYHSAWFYLLMGALAANLIACSWTRFPATLRLFRSSGFPQPGAAFRDADSQVSADIRLGMEEIAGRVEATLKGLRYGKVQRSENIIYGEKGAFSHFGVYFIHLSVLMIVAGAVAGSLLGFDGFANIPVGGSVDAITLKNGRGSHKLDFAIRCDSFKAEFYDTGAPKEFLSEIAILKGGATVLQGPLRVNHPLEYEGVRIFQASYGEEAGSAVINIKYPSGSQQVSAGVGETFELPGNLNPVHVLRVEPNLMRMGPAVKLSVDTPRGEAQVWVFKEIEEIKKQHPGILEMAPIFNPGLLKPYYFSLQEIASRQYTGLQVNSDPGLPLVGAGAVLMVFGFLVVYLMSRRQIWVQLEPGKDGQTVRMSVAGRASRDPVGLERDRKRILQLLNREGIE